MAQEDLNNPNQELNPSTEDQILSILDSDPDFGTPEEAKDDHEEPEEDVEDTSDDDPEDQESDEDVDDTEESEEENSEEEDTEETDETEDEVDDDELFEITVEGETQEVTLDELSNGYLRQEDYTKKTQALAEDRKELQAQQGEVVQLRADLVAQIEAFKSSDKAALEELRKTDWAELKDIDPEGYVEKRAMMAELQDRVAQAEADQTKIAQEQYDENVKAFMAAREQANTFLMSEEGIPGWGDEKQHEGILKNMKEAGLKLGYTEEELQMAIDPRALKALYLASQAMKAQKAKPNIDKKIVKKKPKVTKPGAKRVKRKASLQQKKVQRARTTGRAEDAADAIFGLLDD